MSYNKDILNIKRNLLKESTLITSLNYYDKTKIILDARKASWDWLLTRYGG